MVQVEKRKHGRISIARQPMGELALRVDERRYPIARVKDVSSYGVNVVVDADIAERSRITVEYADETLRLDVYGIIAWRAPADNPGRHIFGVELFSPTLLTAVLGAA